MKKKYHSLLALIILLITNSFYSVSAQEILLIQDSLYSDVLNETRKIQVFLPKNHKAGSGQKYDAIYLLDGEWHTTMASQIQSYVEQFQFMPSSVIVGIVNTNRNRDLLPEIMGDSTILNGADKFLAFIKTELMPYVEQKYPANGENTLFGASFGGIFSFYALLQEPHLFESFIASDPSFWWGHGNLHILAASKLKNLTGLQKTFYMGGREGAAFKQMGIADMDSVFKVHAPEGLKWKSFAYADETHNSVNFKTMYDGLKFSYAGFNPKGLQFHPMNGIVLKDKPIKIWFFDEVANVRYSTDGNEPTPASAMMQNKLTLTGPTDFMLKPFSSRTKYDKVSSGKFREGKVFPAHSKPKKAKSGGFNFSYYEGTWDSLPDFRKLKPILTGITDKDFNFNKLPRKNNFACLIEGYIEIQKDGYYIFGLDSDDGSRMYLADQLLIDYNGLHGMGSVQSFILPLQKGFYPIRLEYFQKGGPGGLELVYLVPESEPRPTPIPLELQYSIK